MTQKATHLYYLLILCLILLMSTACQQASYSGTVSDRFEIDPSLEGFKRATADQPLSFPQDLGAHNDFQTEWWYYTGNLKTETGRDFGYQFTIFRRALVAPTADLGKNEWRTGQVYFAHAAIADIEENRFLFGDRFARGGAGLAGAEAQPYQVWIEDWSVEEIEPGVHRMRAEESGVGFEFILTETQPPVIQGVNGFSAKSSDPKYASHYYSLVGLETSGEIWIGEERYSVSGSSWKDHEYGTDFLSPQTVGWDWFAVHLSNNEKLMFAQVRGEENLTDFVYVSWIDEESNMEPAFSSDIKLSVIETWQSPNTDAIYPREWRLSYPEKKLELTIKTLVDNAELLVGAATYWEGPGFFEGTLNGQPISGYGYIELTGYADEINF